MTSIGLLSERLSTVLGQVRPSPAALFQPIQYGGIGFAMLRGS